MRTLRYVHCDAASDGQDGTERSLIDGFYVYFAPYGEQRADYLRHHVVFGSSVRHAVLSALDVDTSYSIRIQSFSETAGVLSKLSNTVVKQTLGMLAVKLLNLCSDGYLTL